MRLLRLAAASLRAIAGRLEVARAAAVGSKGAEKALAALAFMCEMVRERQSLAATETHASLAQLDEAYAAMAESIRGCEDAVPPPPPRSPKPVSQRLDRLR